MNVGPLDVSSASTTLPTLSLHLHQWFPTFLVSWMFFVISLKLVDPFSKTSKIVTCMWCPLEKEAKLQIL